MSNNKKRGKRIPPDVAAEYFSHLSSAAAKVDRDPPCSPEEVKALMGMFAEIMGMAEKKSSVSFMFGSKDRDWPPNALAAAARAASMYMPPEDCMGYDDEDDDDDDDDEDDDDEDEDEDAKPSAIDPSEWKDLEQVARDEKQEEEARELKAAKKREKKQRKKERLRKEATQKAFEAAFKKQEKLVTSWKSRVVAACQSHDATKLQGLLGESPFKKEEDPKEHIEFLIPNCWAKSTDAVETGADCRLKLADFILHNSSLAFVTISTKTGRSSLHAACFVGDHYLVQFVLDHTDSNDEDEEGDTTFLNLTCEESGFAPIHYAVLSGSRKVFDILMSHGCKVERKTDGSRTSRDGIGITAIELAEAILAGKHDEVKTEGSALLDNVAAFKSNRDDQRVFQAFLRYVIDRMNDVLKNGHVPTPASRKDNEKKEQQEHQKSPSKNKKKKKKKKTQQEQNLALAPAPAPAVRQEDPMIAALLGMGFSNEQIQDAAKACGGMHRATADDLVMWIFAKEAGEDPPQLYEAAPFPEAQAPPPFETPTPESTATAERERVEAARKAEEARLVQQRLVQKREEQRRRNREWNNREQVRQAQERRVAVLSAPTVEAPTLLLEPLDAQHQTTVHSVNSRAIPSIVGHGQTNGQYVGAITAPNKPTLEPIKTVSKTKSPPEIMNYNITSLKKHPTGMESMGSDFARIAGFGVAEDGTVSSLGSGIVGQSDWMNEADSFDPPVLTGFQGGSTFGVAPPGFQFGGSNQQSRENSVADITSLAFATDPNPLGEIRATAKAFVPTNFKPPPGLPNGPVGLSGNSSGGYPVPELSSIGGFNHMAQWNTMSSLPPVVLAPHGGPPPYAQQSTNGFDHILMVPPAQSYSPVPSATSSVTGISAADDLLAPPGVGLPPALGLGSWENPAVPLGSNSDPLGLGLAEQGSISQSGGGVAQMQHVAGAPLNGLSALGETLPLSVFGGAFGSLPSELDDTSNDALTKQGGGWGTTNSSIW